MHATTTKNPINDALRRLERLQNELKLKQRDVLVAIIRGEDQSRIDRDLEELSASISACLDELEAAFRD